MRFKFEKVRFDFIEITVFIFIITKNINSIACFSGYKIINTVCTLVELLSYTTLVLIIWRNSKLYIKHKYLIIFLTVLFGIIFLKSRTIVFIVAALIYFVSKDTYFEKITEMIWKAYFLLILLSFALYFMGISNGGVSRAYSAKRVAPALGFTHANVGGYIFMMMFFAKLATDIQKAYSKKKERKTIIKDSLFCIGNLIIVFFVFKCRTVTIVCLLTMILLSVMIRINFNNRLLKYVFCMAHPIMLSLTYISAIVYPNSITLFLDKIITSRFFLLNYHLMRNQITLFGSIVDYSIYTLDNSYLSFLLQYGLIPTLVFVFASIITVCKAWKNKDGYIIALLLGFLMYGFTENGIFDIHVNFTYLYLLVGNSPLKMKFPKSFLRRDNI